MAQERRFKEHDFTYSAWHRTGSTKRFVGIEKAQLLGLVDIDGALWVEYDDHDTRREPLALIETAKDIGHDSKPFTVIKALAQRCFPVVPAYVVLYKVSDRQNPADPSQKDIDYFRVKRVWPEPESDYQRLSPVQWAEMLLLMRRQHARLLDAHMLSQEAPKGPLFTYGDD